MSKKPEIGNTGIIGEGSTNDRNNSNRNSDKPYDNAFHTMVHRLPKYLIPLVNEFFHENFRIGDEVVVQSSDLPSVEREGRIRRRYSDSLFSIKGAETKIFHIECESRPDGSIVIRMVEYGFLKALRDKRMEDGVLVIEMPNSAVVFLRCTANTPDRFWVKIITPGGDAWYPVEVLKFGRYNLEEIFEKNLLLLLPFYIFVYENALPEINEDCERLEQLKAVYEEILRRLRELCMQERLSLDEERLMVSIMRHVLDGVAGKYDQVRKEVGDTMLGEVIDNEMTRMLDEMHDMDARLSKAKTKLGEAETRLGETETKLDRAERLNADIRCATEYLSKSGRAEEIIRLYQEDSFLEEVLKAAR